MAFKTFILRIASAVSHRKPNAPGHIESNSLELYVREFKVKENVETQENWIHQYKSELRKRDKILALTSHLISTLILATSRESRKNKVD